MRLSETARVVKHHLKDVVINRMMYYISQGWVETPIRRGGKFCCSFVTNLLQYPYAKKYENTMRFDKVIAKIKWCRRANCPPKLAALNIAFNLIYVLTRREKDRNNQTTRCKVQVQVKHLLLQTCQRLQ